MWHPTDADMLATASGDRTVRIWDARLSKAVANISTKVPRQKLPNKKSRINHLHFPALLIIIV